MNSAVFAVIFCSVLMQWILIDHSVVGRYCGIDRPRYIFNPDLIPFNPLQWVMLPLSHYGMAPVSHHGMPPLSHHGVYGGNMNDIDDSEILTFRSSANTGAEKSMRKGKRQRTNAFPTFTNYPFGMYDPSLYSPPIYNYWDSPIVPEARYFPEPRKEENFYKVSPKLDTIDDHPNWKLIDREQCGESLADRIIGGTDAILGQYPWLALIGFKNRSDPKTEALFSCGGALITPCWVLSAAHCVSQLPEDFYISAIRLGEYNLDTSVDCDATTCAPKHQDFTPVRIIKHKQFNTPKLKNDVSLIKLERPAVLSQWVQPICLPYGRLLTANLIGKMGEVAGWGIENIATGQSSRILKTVKLPVRENNLCQNTYKANANIGDNQLCVGGVVGFDSCNGDSGGPFMRVDVANNTTPKYYMIGIVSFGAKKCGVKPSPGVYTKVAKFMDWILDHITAC